LKVQLHAVGVQPAFITLGMFATHIEPAGTGTRTPEVFGALAGHDTLFPPLGKDTVTFVEPAGGVRMTVLTTEFPLGVRL
jgi:hypothetical protein